MEEQLIWNPLEQFAVLVVNYSISNTIVLEIL